MTDQNDSPEVTGAMDYVQSVAPDDVRRTIDWLTENGWYLAGGQGGRAEPFGDALVEFSNGGDRIRITRDRSQWLMHIQRPSWSRKFDLDIILDTIGGREDWSESSRPLPEQLPPGVSWLAALPEVLVWLASGDDIEPVLAHMQLKRSRSLFPSAPRPKR